MNLAAQIITDLKENGVNTFFGVQGGACARFIDEIDRQECTYVPVLNEQAAGYCAHGYYLASRKPAGIIATTGPGVTNSISGVASCYHDSVPLIFLLGQVGLPLNTASKYGVKMVGFQELPHCNLIKPVADIATNISDITSYANIRNSVLKGLAEDKKVIALEVNDDVQRLEISVDQLSNEQLEPDNTLSSPSRDYTSSLNADLILLGAGASDLSPSLVNKLNETGIPQIVTWGAQHMAHKLTNYSGIFGTHSPGLANQLIRQSKTPLVIGASLLQHQAGRNSASFLPNASQIIYVNISRNEGTRAESFFGKERLDLKIMTCESFLTNHELIKSNELDSNIHQRLDYSKPNFSPPHCLRMVFEEFQKIGNKVFLDAGATLSWSYQALNMGPPLTLEAFTSFNLHPMGWANCAQVGASYAIPNEVTLCVIGDGSIPMNSQELANKTKEDKIIVVENQGYGIIRQTQKQFYDSNFAGSSFSHKSASLPDYSVYRICESYLGEGSVLHISENQCTHEIVKGFFMGEQQVMILSIDKTYEVVTDFFD